MFDTPANAANAEKHHAKLNLSAADHAIYDAAMQAFANSPKGRTVARSLLSRLSADGQAKLKAFMQAEKVHTQYHTQPAVAQ
jgi:hypothetical protein